MASTEILQFAGGGGANVLSQAAWAALTSLLANGFTAGVADPATCNKLFRQSSFMAAGLANWIADQGISVPDDGNLTNLVQELDTALRIHGACVDTSGVANTVTATVAPAPASLSNGISVNVQVANTNTGASTFNLNGLGAKSITNQGNALVGGELKAGQYAKLIYDGTAWEIMSNLVSATSVYVGAAPTTGSANAQVLATVTPSGYTLKVGEIVNFAAGYSNSGAATLNVNSTGALAIMKPSALGLVAVANGDIVSGTSYQVVYNGSVYQLNTGSFPSPSTFCQVANNLSDVVSAATARTNLGLGTASTAALTALLQAANNLSDVVSAATARTNLGLGTAAVLSSGAFLQPSNNLSDVGNATTARANLGAIGSLLVGSGQVGSIADGWGGGPFSYGVSYAGSSLTYTGFPFGYGTWVCLSSLLIGGWGGSNTIYRFQRIA